MIQFGDCVNDHENIRGRGPGRGQNPWSTQKKSERTALKNYSSGFVHHL